MLKALPAKFSLVFDAWSVGDVDVLRVCDTFAETRKGGVGRVLIAISSVGDELCLDADEHIWSSFTLLQAF